MKLTSINEIETISFKFINSNYKLFNATTISSTVERVFILIYKINYEVKIYSIPQSPLRILNNSNGCDCNGFRRLDWFKRYLNGEGCAFSNFAFRKD